MSKLITKNDLKAILDKILPQKEVVSTTVAGYAGNIYLYRSGNVVYFKAQFVPSSSATSSGATLPQSIPNGYRPISTAYVNLVNYTDKGSRIQIDTVGAISHLSSVQLATNTYIYASACWITENDYPSS